MSELHTISLSLSRRIVPTVDALKKTFLPRRPQRTQRNSWRF